VQSVSAGCEKIWTIRLLTFATCCTGCRFNRG